MNPPRHFLDLDLVGAETLRRILSLGTEFKSGKHPSNKPLEGKTLVMIFEKPSTRTRVSFQIGMHQLGGDTVVLDYGEMQLAQGETPADTARVLSRYADAIMIRTDAADKLHEMSAHASVPVINGLTDDSHPCQLMADVMTFEEHRGPIAGKVVAWCGDGNNMAVSWIHAAACFEFELRLACPADLRPRRKVLDWARDGGGKVSVIDDPRLAVRDADCVVTDTWISMGDKEAANRHNQLVPFRVDEALMALAKDDAVFMHCLPAHRGQEVTAAVIDGPQSLVWDEAENRLHAQKGILAWCMA